MKYEEIKSGESYKIGYTTKKVIEKNDEHKVILTVDVDGYPIAWSQNELKNFQPIKKELPESGLVVNKYGGIVYKIDNTSGFGFNSCGHYYVDWEKSDLNNLKQWRVPTPCEQAKFIKLLEAEAEKHGLGVDVKLKGHAGVFDGSLNENQFLPIFHLTAAWNKNGRIFHNGIWAEPLTMLDEVTGVIKKHLPNIVVEMIDGVVTLRQL